MKPVSDERLQQIIDVGDMWCGSPEMPDMAAEILILRAELTEARTLLANQAAEIATLREKANGK